MTTTSEQKAERAEVDGAAAMAAALAPLGVTEHGAEVRPAAQDKRARPTTDDIALRRRIEEVGTFAADGMLAGLVSQFAAHHQVALGHLNFGVPEIREVRQLIAMADRLGARAAAQMVVSAERGGGRG